MEFVIQDRLRSKVFWRKLSQKKPDCNYYKFEILLIIWNLVGLGSSQTKQTKNFQKVYFINYYFINTFKLKKKYF